MPESKQSQQPRGETRYMSKETPLYVVIVMSFMVPHVH